MGAQRNHKVELGCIPENINQAAKKERERQGTGMIRDENEQLLLSKKPIQTLEQSRKHGIRCQNFSRRRNKVGG